VRNAEKDVKKKK